MAHVNWLGERRQVCSKDFSLESVLTKIKTWDWKTIGWLTKRLPVGFLAMWACIESVRVLAVAHGSPVDRITLLDWPLRIIFGN